MRFAITRSRKRVDAADALWSHEYFCPDCDARVYLTRRSVQVAHFRHAPNESSTACSNYVQGYGTGRFSVARRYAVEDKADQPGLGLEVEVSGRWTLFLRVPEIPNRELGALSLRSLDAAAIRVLAGGFEAETLSALEVRPGVGRARLRVPPVKASYELTTSGPWPEPIDVRRWNSSAPGVDDRGTVFRLRHGEYLRVERGSTLDWGEHLFLLADLAVSAPPGCDAQRLGASTFGGTTWSLHRVVLPASESEQTTRWFRSIGLEIVEPHWLVSLSSIPIEFDPSGVPLYALGEAVLAEVRSPEGDSDALAHLGRGGERVSTGISTDDRARAFVQCTARGLGQHTIAAGDLLDSKINYGVRPAPTLDELQRELRGVPRLLVRLDGNEIGGWGREIVLPEGARPDDISISTTYGELDVRLRLEWSEGLAVRVQDLGIGIATQRLRELLHAGIARVDVDAAALGRLTFRRSSRQIAPRVNSASRLVPFFTARAEAASDIVLRGRKTDPRITRYRSNVSPSQALLRTVARGKR